MLPDVYSETVPAATWTVLELCNHPILVAYTELRLRDDCVDELADLPLEENMVLKVEAMVFALGEASLHIE